MNTVHFRFGKYLEKSVSDDPWGGVHGPLFTKWLPDGEKDALTLPAGHANVEMTVWFDRRGYPSEYGIRYDVQRKEVDLAIMCQQDRLSAGPISGRLVIRDASDEECQAIKENATGSQEYVGFGKRVLGMLCPPLKRLVRILKVNYGQYWLTDIEDWDSRKESLGSYCSSFCLRWSLDDGASWSDFRPSENVRTIALTFRTDYSFYLEEKDWKHLASLCMTDYEPTTAAELLAYAHRLFDQGQLKYAIIEAVSALEVSIDEHVRTRYRGKSRELLVNDGKAGETRRLPVRTALVAGMIPSIHQDDIERALATIDLRNSIIHEGKEPTAEAGEKLQGLIRVVAGVLQGPGFKFPILNA